MELSGTARARPPRLREIQAPELTLRTPVRTGTPAVPGKSLNNPLV